MATQVTEAAVSSRTISLRELAAFFLRLGTTAFGGPAAHVAMMEDELVRRRQWLSREKFLDLLGASNLIPGPSSSELAIHIGYLCGGWRGLLVAGTCFILPAAVMVALLASLYVRFDKLPAAMGILYGIKPVVIAVILQALWNLGRTAIKTKFLAFVGFAALLFSLLGLHPLFLLLVAGVMACASQTRLLQLSLLSPVAIGTVGLATSFSLASLFVVFLRIGAVVFGSGYVLLAFL